MMSQRQFFAGLLSLMALAAPPLLAQPAGSDEGAQRLIDQLCPPGANCRPCPPGEICRGIRMPGADTGTPNPPPTLSPAPQAATQAPDAAPQPPIAALPQPPALTIPPSSDTMSSRPSGTMSPRSSGTTAPAGVAAVSITVNFATGSATLTPQAAAALGDLGRALASVELAPFRFRIEGHTDTVGDERQNMLLSQRRAESVRDFLTKRFGLAPGRLVAVGLGESQPLVPTPDQTPEPSNRRVQVLNLGS